MNNPSHALPGDETPFLVYTAALCVVALGLCVVDPVFRRGPAASSRSL